MLSNQRRDVDVAVPATADLGEGPFVDGDHLVWVDLTAGDVHRSDLITGDDEITRYGGVLGAAVPAASGGYAAVTDQGFALLAEGRAETVHPVAADPAMRMNDAACDAAGRLWAGSTAYDFRPGAGALWVWEAGTPARQADDGYALANGIGWSPDGTTCYVVDSMVRLMYQYAFDVGTARLSNRTVLCEFEQRDGLPDGLAVDADGHVWVAFWGGRCLRRIAPDGAVAERIDLPVTHPTSCAFGSGGRLYVTTAREELTGEQLRAEPAAGSVLVVDAGVDGVAVHPFAG